MQEIAIRYRSNLILGIRQTVESDVAYSTYSTPTAHSVAAYHSVTCHQSDIPNLAMSREQLNRFISNDLSRTLDPRPHASCTAEQTLEPGYASKKSKTPPPSPSNRRPSIFPKSSAPSKDSTVKQGQTLAVMSVANAYSPKKSSFKKKIPPQKKKKKEDSLRHQTRNIVSLLAYARNNAREWIPRPRSPKKNKKFPSFDGVATDTGGVITELFFSLSLRCLEFLSDSRS